MWTVWPGCRSRELRLLEVGVDMHARERHEGGEARARLDILAGLDRLVADDAVERRADLGEGEVALGLVHGGLQFGRDLLGFRLLRLRRPHWRCAAVEGGLGALDASASVRSRSALAWSKRDLLAKSDLASCCWRS